MKTRILSLLTLLAGTLTALATPPANDNFSGAVTLATQIFGSNSDATVESGEPGHTGSPALHSVWWNYTATATGPLEIETFGSSFDTRLSVYTGASVNALTLVAENDDHNVEIHQSRVTFTATAGTVYHIAVDGFAGQTGTIELTVQDATPPANDNFASATDLGSVATATSAAHNVGATAEVGESPHGGQAPDLSVWWKWTAPFSGDVQIDTVGSNVDTLLGVYTGTAVNALTLVAENDDGPGIGDQSRVTFAAVSGTTYMIAVDSYNGVEGDVTLNIAEVTSLAPPVNDNFANPTALPPGIAATVSGTNDHATHENDEPLHANKATADTVWWTWTPLAPGAVTLSTVGSTFDTVLAVYTGSALNALTGVASNDDISGTVTQSAVTFTAAAGTTYRIVVGGYGVATGSIALSLAQTPVAPVNDQFANRSNLGNAATVNATGVNLGATAEAGEPAHAGTAAGQSVWWKWTCPADEYVTLTTAGSIFDTVLAVYTGTSPDALTAVAANDDADPGAVVPVRTSLLHFFATTGTTYVIAVDGKAGAAGAVTLNLAPTPPPDNDNFSSAAVLTGTSAAVSSVNYDATAEAGEPSHAGSAAGHSVWWNWTAPSDGIIVLSSEGSAIDTRLAVYTGNAVNALTLVMANDNEPEALHTWSLVRFRAHAGITYRIALDGAASSQGLIQLSLTEGNITGDNDAFADRIDLGIAAATSATGTNLGASAEAGEPGHRGAAAEESVWWKWTAPATGWTRISAGGSDFPLRLGVYTGSAVNALTAVSNVQDNTGDLTSINFHTVAGTTYVIAVDGVAGHEGSIVLTIGAGIVPALPENDNFASRTVLLGAAPAIVASGSNLYATPEVGEPAHGGLPAGNSVWYQWTAPFTGRILLDGTAMAFAPRLGVYTGSTVGALTTVVQSASVGDDLLEFNATAGTVYQIAVDDSGSFAAGGGIAFTIDYKTPANDNFANAIDLNGTLPISASGITSHATAEPGEPAHAGVTATDSIWWKWTAPASGLITMETTGSEIDTVLGVYTGTSVAALTLVAANDEAASGIHSSLVTFTATAGTTYRIAVDGYQGSSGAVSLAIHAGVAPQAPPNDNFANATDLGGDHPLTVSGTNDHATAETGEPAHAGNPAIDSVWWKWTAPIDTIVTVDTLGSDEDTVLAVYTGVALNALTLVASNDDANGGTVQSSVTFAATAGTTYRFAVDGYGGHTGTIVLNLGISAPSNDQFAHRTPLGNGSTFSVAGSSAGATAEAGEPAHAGVPAAHSIWWTWTAPVNMAVDLHTFGSELDTVLAVYTGTALNALTQVASNDDESPTDHNSRVVFNAVAGTAYQIVVASATTGDMGDIDISLSQTAIVPPPANDAFANAVNLLSVTSATFTGTNVGATTETSEPAHAGTPAHDSVWWKWTAPFNGALLVDTLGSSIDTKLAIYTGSTVGNLTAVGFNDDATAGVVQSRVSIPVVAGTTYSLAVDGFSGAEGALALHLSLTGGSPGQIAYAAWGGANLPPSTSVQNQAISADPDGDGLSNGIEFLMGLNPAVANGSKLSVSRDASTTILTYPRASGVPAGIETIEASNNLTAWTTLTTGQMSVVNTPGIAGQPATIAISVSNSSGYRFFRIRVTITP